MSAALQDLPALADALERGMLPWSKVRLLVRIATPDNEIALAGVPSLPGSRGGITRQPPQGPLRTTLRVRAVARGQ